MVIDSKDSPNTLTYMIANLRPTYWLNQPAKTPPLNKSHYTVSESRHLE